MTGNDSERAVSSIAQRAWNELLQDGLVTGAPPPDQGSIIRDEALLEYYQSVNNRNPADTSRISEGLSPVSAQPGPNGISDSVFIDQSI